PLWNFIECPTVQSRRVIVFSPARRAGVVQAKLMIMRTRPGPSLAGKGTRPSSRRTRRSERPCRCAGHTSRGRTPRSARHQSECRSRVPPRWPSADDPQPRSIGDCDLVDLIERDREVMPARLAEREAFVPAAVGLRRSKLRDVQVPVLLKDRVELPDRAAAWMIEVVRQAVDRDARRYLARRARPAALPADAVDVRERVARMLVVATWAVDHDGFSRVRPAS